MSRTGDSLITVGCFHQSDGTRRQEHRAEERCSSLKSDIYQSGLILKPFYNELRLRHLLQSLFDFIPTVKHRASPVSATSRRIFISTFERTFHCISVQRRDETKSGNLIIGNDAMLLSTT